MNGILNVLKPAGMTSFDVVGFLRKTTAQKKIGHTGTLDPMAVGVLPICFGNATKAIEFMIDKDKTYRAELTLGAATDTQDSSGQVLYQKEVTLDVESIKSAIMEFRGEIQQLPPMYSAIKIGGRKLYEIAREGGTVERQPRSITIYDIDIVRIWDNGRKVLFDVHCSKGTYIRTLCHDIGERLGCGGHMSFLERTKAGKYSIESALTLEKISELAENKLLDNYMLSAESVFDGYGSVVLNESEMFKYNNGVWIGYDGISENENPVVKIYDTDKNFIGIGEFVINEKRYYLKSKKFIKL